MKNNNYKERVYITKINCSALIDSIEHPDTLFVLPEDCTDLFWGKMSLLEENLKGGKNWDTSRVTNMDYMFCGAKNIEIDASSWDVRGVKSMNRMFDSSSNIKLDISNWIFDKPVNIRAMFQGGRDITVNASNSNIIALDSQDLFNSANNIRVVGGEWILGEESNGLLFDAKNIDLSSTCLNSEQVINLERAFCLSDNIDIDLSQWNTERVVNLRSAFFRSLNSNFDVGNWNTPLVKDMTNVFYNADGNYSYIIKEWNLESNPIMRGALYNSKFSHKYIGREIESTIKLFDKLSVDKAKEILSDPRLNSIDLNRVRAYVVESDSCSNDIIDKFFNHKNIKHQMASASHLKCFNDDNNKILNSKIVNSNFKIALLWEQARRVDQEHDEIRYISRWRDRTRELNRVFSECFETQENLHTLYHMPDDCSSIFDERKDLFWGGHNWDVSNTENMNSLFYTSRSKPDTSDWDVSSVTNLSYMFAYTKLANPDVSNWDVSSVTNLSHMFAYTKLANPDVSNWDVSKVKDISGMFYYAKLANPDVSSWNISSVEDLSYMFKNAEVADVDISSWKLREEANIIAGMGLISFTKQNVILKAEPEQSIENNIDLKATVNLLLTLPHNEVKKILNDMRFLEKTRDQIRKYLLENYSDRTICDLFFNHENLKEQFRSCYITSYAEIFLRSDLVCRQFKRELLARYSREKLDLYWQEN